MQNIKTRCRIIFVISELSRKEIVSPSFPVCLLVDVFDITTLDFCERLFKFVESNVTVFKQETFFFSCKNALLRMCNDLLRRLSRSQNTVFCGQILLFLAKFFPFSERSGLNVVSEFNIENITEFEFASAIESSNTIDDNNVDSSSSSNNNEVNAQPTTSHEDSSSMKLDRHLYLKFWALQEFFRCPYTCYDKEKFKKFSSYTKDVLAAFKSYKLEETRSLSGDGKFELPSENSDHFFAKFLTNPKLLALQLGDSNFRRTILIQYLILFQYLVSTIKFKGENDKLSDTQQEYVQETEAFVYKLLNETPPKGKEFSEAIKHILKREEIWSSWKDGSCKEIKRPEGFDKEMPEQRKRKLLGDEISIATKAAKFELGNPELSRLWNLCPDNLQACKGSDRNFLPPLETYLENKDMYSDGKGKDKVDPTYEWRALRLVSRQSSFFFTLLAQPNEKVEKISDYLNLFKLKIQKEKVEIKTELSGGIDVVELPEALVEEETTENIEDEVEDENPHKDTGATAEQIVEISKAVGDGWQKLGLKLLGVEQDVIQYYATKNPDSPCELMLTCWFNDDDDASLENLVYTLEGLDFEKAVNLVKKMIESEETMIVE